MSITQRNLGESVDDYFTRTGYTGDQFGNVDTASTVNPVPVLSSVSGGEQIQSDLTKLSEYTQPKTTTEVKTETKTPEYNRFGVDSTGKPLPNPNVGDNAFSPEQLTAVGITDPIGEGLIFDPSRQVYTVSDGTTSQRSRELLGFQQKSGLASTTLDTDENWVMGEMKKAITGVDALLADTLGNIQSDYQNRRAQLEQLNAASVGRIQTSGYRYGTARYAPTLNDQLISTEERAGIQKLSELATETQSLLLKAKQAAQSNKFDMLYKYMGEIDKKKEAQTKAAEALAKAKTDQDKLISEGLQKQKDADAKVKAEWEKTKTDVILDLQKNNAPQSVVDAASNVEEGNVGALATAAGSWLQTATGDLGEVLAIEREMLRRGLIPPTREELLTRVANQKAKANALASGVYSSNQEKAITKVNDTVSKNATYAKTTSMRTFANNVFESLSLRNGVSDIAAINQFQKVIDEGAVTRDQDVKLIQQSQSLANALQTRVKRLAAGDQLSDDQRAQMKELVTSIYNKQVEALKKDPYIKAKTKELERVGINAEDTILGELEGLTANNLADDMSVDEENAKNTLISYGNTDPTARARILELVSTVSPELGRPLTYSEVLQLFPIKIQ